MAGDGRDSGNRLVRALLVAPALGRSEVAAALLAFTALAAVVFGEHIAHGGLYNDDWAHHTSYWYGPGGSFIDRIDAYDALAFRPLAMVYWATTYGAFAGEGSLHLALTTAVSVGMVTALFVLLRALGFERWHAGVVAALVLVAPMADSTRLWTANAISTMAILLYLVGCTVAIRALRRPGRGSIGLHLVSLCLYAASILFYEIATAAVLASVALYLVVGPVRSALRRWVADVLLVGVLVALFTSNTFYDPLPLAELDDHARQIADEGAELVARSAIPFGDPRVALVALAALAIVATAATLLWSGRVRGSRLRELRRWLAALGGAVGATAIGWATIVPAAHLSPLAPGQFNRANALAAIGIVLGLYSLLMLAGTSAAHLLRRGPLIAPALAGAASLVIGLAYISDVLANADRWDQAAAEQRRIVKAVSTALVKPPAGTFIFTFGHPTSVEYSIPIFAARWDLDGALKKEWDTGAITAWPMVPGTVLRCGRSAVRAMNWNDEYGPPQLGPYGSTTFVDVSTRRSRRIATRADCRAASRSFQPGPLYIPPAS